MKFVPRKYQEMMIDYILAHDRCAIWAGMGMGKTVATLTAINILQNVDGYGKALVIAPLRVARMSWLLEAQKWDHLRGLWVKPLVGAKRRRSQNLDMEADVYALNYERIPWLMDELKERGMEWPFEIVVLDEATRIKSYRRNGGGSKRAAALASIQDKVLRLIELTGTPAPNGLEDLWGQIYFLDKGKRLGTSFSAFHSRWFRPLHLGAQAFAVRWVPLPGADREIKDRVKDITLTLNTEDWFDIEKPLQSFVYVELEKSSKRLYNTMERQMYLELGDGTSVEAVNAAAKTSKCLQIASGAVYTEEEGGRFVRVIHNEKLGALSSIVEEAAGRPVLVAYQFKHEAARILEKFKKTARLLDKNPETLKAWNRGEIPILLAHPASCGHGLSLQDGGNILVFFSVGWNLEEHEQIIERIGPARQKQSGHERPVYVYYIVAKGTLDEAVLTRLETKREVMDILLERKASRPRRGRRKHVKS